jgi:hypothetical protein
MHYYQKLQMGTIEKFKTTLKSRGWTTPKSRGLLINTPCSSRLV